MVLSDEEAAAVARMKKKQRMKNKQKKLSYFEKAELQQQRYREARWRPPRIAPPPPPKPPKVVEDLKVKKRHCVCLKRCCRVPPRIAHWGLTPHANKACEAFGLTRKEVQTLHDRFEDMDTFGQGQITRTEFWQELDIVGSSFTEKLFEMIDSDGSGRIDFSEFVCILCTYCIFNKEDILRFAFDCYDLDGSGRIDKEEVNALITMLNEQDPKFAANIQAAQEKILEDQDGELDFEEFRDLANSFPLLLQPAFELQDNMHRHTLGAKDWVKILENIAHGEAQETIEETQFGMPVKVSSTLKFLRYFGFAKSFRRVDLRYINSMRPSRHAYEKPDPFAEEEQERKRKEAKQKEKAERKRAAAKAREEEKEEQQRMSAAGGIFAAG